MSTFQQIFLWIFMIEPVRRGVNPPVILAEKTIDMGIEPAMEPKRAVGCDQHMSSAILFDACTIMYARARTQYIYIYTHMSIYSLHTACSYIIYMCIHLMRDKSHPRWLFLCENLPYQDELVFVTREVNGVEEDVGNGGVQPGPSRKDKPLSTSPTIIHYLE